MAALNEQEVMELPKHLGNVRRLSEIGYGNSRVTSLTDLASFIADLVTYRDLVNPAYRPIVDAMIDTVQWLSTYGILTTTTITALTTFYDVTVSATTDLSYNIRGHAQYPATFSATVGADVPYFQPAQ
jgi:hypothetical protein